MPAAFQVESDPQITIYMFTPTVEQSMWLVAIYQTAQ